MFNTNFAFPENIINQYLNKYIKFFKYQNDIKSFTFIKIYEDKNYFVKTMNNK